MKSFFGPFFSLLGIIALNKLPPSIQSRLSTIVASRTTRPAAQFTPIICHPLFTAKNRELMFSATPFKESIKSPISSFLTLQQAVQQRQFVRSLVGAPFMMQKTPLGAFSPTGTMRAVLDRQKQGTVVAQKQQPPCDTIALQRDRFFDIIKEIMDPDVNKKFTDYKDDFAQCKDFLQRAPALQELVKEQLIKPNGLQFSNRLWAIDDSKLAEDPELAKALAQRRAELWNAFDSKSVWEKAKVGIKIGQKFS